jgi:hypothetical protein
MAGVEDEGGASLAEAEGAELQFEAAEHAHFRILKEGLLKKKKKRLSVSNRRLTLLEERPTGSFLAYHDATPDGERGEQKGELPLSGALVQQADDKFVVTVTLAGHKNCGRPITFVCASQAEAVGWAAAIRDSVGLGERWKYRSDVPPTEWAAGARDYVTGPNGAKYAKCKGPLAEDEARVLVQGLGLSLGGGGYGWSGDFFVKGLYVYDSTGGGTGRYAHCAYFGTGGTDSQVLGPVTKPGMYRPFLERPDGPTSSGTNVIDGVEYTLAGAALVDGSIGPRPGIDLYRGAYSKFVVVSFPGKEQAYWNYINTNRVHRESGTKMPPFVRCACVFSMVGDHGDPCLCRECYGVDYNSEFGCMWWHMWKKNVAIADGLQGVDTFYCVYSGYWGNAQGFEKEYIVRSNQSLLSVFSCTLFC